MYFALEDVLIFTSVCLLTACGGDSRVRSLPVSAIASDLTQYISGERKGTRIVCVMSAVDVRSVFEAFTVARWRGLSAPL